MKKGQLTIIMIVAVIIIIATGTMIYFSQREVTSDEIRRLLVDVPEMAKPIAAYVYSCLEGAIPLGVKTIASSGGYIFPINAIPSEYGEISYGYRKGENTLISLEEMQNQLSGFIGASVSDCFDPVLFEKQGYTIEIESISASAKIAPTTIITTLNFPIRITKGDSSVTVSDFALQQALPLGKLYGVAGQIVTQLQDNPIGLNLGAFQNIGAEIETIPINNENMLIGIRSLEAGIGEELLTFMFAAEFEVNAPPRFIDLPDEFIISEDEKFSYTVKAEDPNGDDFTFFAEKGLFGLNETTGYFEFTPEITGEFDVMFEVKDIHRATYRKKVKFIIEER